MENQTSEKITIIWTNNGGKFVNHEFKDFCEIHGIIMQLTMLYIPKQYGVVGHKN